MPAFSFADGAASKLWRISSSRFDDCPDNKIDLFLWVFLSGEDNFSLFSAGSKLEIAESVGKIVKQQIDYYWKSKKKSHHLAERHQVSFEALIQILYYPKCFEPQDLSLIEWNPENECRKFLSQKIFDIIFISLTNASLLFLSLSLTLDVNLTTASSSWRSIY